MPNITELDALKTMVRMLLHDLPQHRDWLDPELERELRVMVKAQTPASNHRALLKTWKTQEDHDNFMLVPVTRGEVS